MNFPAPLCGFSGIIYATDAVSNLIMIRDSIIENAFWFNFGTAGLQKYLLGKNSNEWSTMYDTTWNIFSIFMGECVFDTNRIPSKAIKLLVGLCMFYFFIICAAYAGILKGFLTSPILSSKIETPQDVCIQLFTIHFHDSICF